MKIRQIQLAEVSSSSHSHYSTHWQWINTDGQWRNMRSDKVSYNPTDRRYFVNVIHDLESLGYRYVDHYMTSANQCIPPDELETTEQLISPNMAIRIYTYRKETEGERNQP